MKQQTNLEELSLKDLIAQAGFKSQAEFARYMNVNVTKTVGVWCKKTPKHVVKHLTLIINGNANEEKNKKKIEKLESDLNVINGYLHPES